MPSVHTEALRDAGIIDWVKRRKTTFRKIMIIFFTFHTDTFMGTSCEGYSSTVFTQLGEPRLFETNGGSPVRRAGQLDLESKR